MERGRHSNDNTSFTSVVHTDVGTLFTVSHSGSEDGSQVTDRVEDGLTPMYDSVNEELSWEIDP